MKDIRHPVFAGSWYPAEARECRDAIQRFLEFDPDAGQAPQTWLGGIVPHAGWHYSGRIACNVIACLKDPAPIDVVILFGMHLHPAAGNFMMPRGIWRTPLGDLPVSEELADYMLQRFKFKIETATRFSQDNTIELQLPFVKALLEPTAILALGVPPAPVATQIGRAAARWALENRRCIKVIGSTDLTHYGSNYGFTPRGSGRAALEWVRSENDRRIIETILALTPEQIIAEGLEQQNACCAGAAAGAVAAAVHLGARRSRMLAYATSHEQSPGENFVGYAGILLGNGKTGCEEAGTSAA